MYESLSHKDKKKTEIHFRYLAESNIVERKLSDSMRRCINEMEILFQGEFQFNMTEMNGIRQDIYPFSSVSGQETELHVFEEFSPTVYSDGILLSGSPRVSNKMKKIANDSVFALIYREQFVLRLTVTLDALRESKLNNFINMLQNVQQNADMEGVTCLSVESTTPLGFDVSALFPDNSISYSCQPIMGFEPRQVLTHSFNDIGIDVTSHTQIQEYIQDSYYNDVIYSSEDTFIDAPPFLIEGHPLQTSTIIHLSNNDEEPTVSLLGDYYKGRIWPLLVHFESESNDGPNAVFISRHINMPIVQTVSQAFYLGRGYPASHFFGDVAGAQYSSLLLAVKEAAAPFHAGLVIDRGISDKGRVEFGLGVGSLAEDGMLDVQFIFGGGEAEMEDYMSSLFNKLAECEKIDVDDILDASEDLEIAMETVVE
jgi:hypothetical protein